MNHAYLRTPSGDMAGRDALIAALRVALESQPWVIAAWLGGSDSNGRTDQWSDIDLIMIVEDDKVEEAFAACKAALNAISRIGVEIRLPTPTWHGHDQAFWQLEGIPDWWMIDAVVMRRNSTAPKFLEVERHGTPLALLDRENAMQPELFDRVAHAAKIKERLAAMVPRFRLLQHLVKKSVWRGDASEAADRYMSYTLRPLVELMRIRHCPDRFDFGMRYLKDDLPESAWREIESLALPGTLEAVLAAQARAEAAFDRELKCVATAGARAP